MIYTVIGYMDDSEDPQIAGVIEGDHNVIQTMWGRWWVTAEANSPEQAETLAMSKIEEKMEKERP